MTTERSSAADVEVGRAGTVMVITINRPAQRNAMTLAAAEAIAGALDELDGDTSLTGAVLTGQGAHFCAGMDLKRFVQFDERPYVPGRGFAGIVERPPSKPIIAAVEGWALGGGFEVVLACDLVVAAEGARFGLPEVKRGLVARGGGMFRLPRVLPLPVALEMLLTGEPLDADAAHRHGLVNRVVEDGRALDGALELAQAVGRNAPMAVAASKRIARAALDWPESECFERQRADTDAVFASADAAEGATAFAERRSPEWRGR
jgi:enoyl-CoA hydratase/carnithine racemase